MRAGVFSKGDALRRAKYKRSTLGIPKSHRRDNACVGEVGRASASTDAPNQGLWDAALTAGRGRTSTVSCAVRMRTKRVRGFKTGGVVRADVPKGARKDGRIGRVAVRKADRSTSIRLNTSTGKYCQFIHRADGRAGFADCGLRPDRHCRLPATVASGGF